MTALLAAVARTARFRVNGRPVEVAGPGGRRLLDVLRWDLGLTGTKEGCGEGECGACSVLVDGELVNSCLVPVAQVDRCEVLTVEGLAAGGFLDPVQQAFLDAGGTQCGFCAPGLLLAAHALLDAGRPAGDADIREAIAGNLCRCTGYTKVVEAIEGAAGALAAAGTTRRGRAGEALGVGPAGWGVERGPAPGTQDRWRVPAAVGLPPATGPAVIRPASLADALARLRDDPAPRVVAGGTDVMVELAAGVASPERPLLDIRDLDELRGTGITGDELVIGAGTTFTELRSSTVVHGALPVLAEAAASVGAVQVRNRGTIGGNCVTASPAGDLLPLLLVTDARLEAAGPGGSRTIPAAAFWTGYRQTALRPDELLVAIRIPLVPGRRVLVRKIGTRRAQAIAKVIVALAWRDDGSTEERAPAAAGPLRDVRVALGSVAPRPIRAPRTEALLEGGIPDRELAERAAATVREEISPIDDVRSTASYRRAVTGRVLRRLVLDALPCPD